MNSERITGTRKPAAVILLLLLVFTLVLFFSSCNSITQEYTQSQSEQESSTAFQASALYDTETVVPSTATFPEDIRMSQGTLYTLTEGDETAAITRYDYTGMVLDSVTVPLMPEHYSDEHTRVFEDIQWIVFDGDLVYFQRGTHTENLTCLEALWQHNLECWDMTSGEMCWSVDITNELFLYDYECGLDNLYLTEHNLLATTSEEVYVLDKQGGYVDHIPRGIPLGTTLCQDRDGNIYWSHLPSQGDLEPLDLEQMTAGALFTLIPEEELRQTEWCRIIPGGGAYDFFILRDTDLLGASFSDGLICLTTWESLGITWSPVEGVYLGDGTFLLLLRDGETWDRSVAQITLPGAF